ncbi:unnamed protein product [Closterium sp. NIES-53]
MASLRVLAFDHEGRLVQFDTWLDDLQLYLLSDIKDGVSLFDHVSGAATAPPTTADSATRSQWLSRDAAARLAIRNHLPLAECAHFGQHKTGQALYDAVVAPYSSPATAALCRLLLPYLFPELSAFATVEDLVSHLRASDARYRAAVPAEFLDKNQPPMFITLYFIVTRLFGSLCSVRDHFLSLDPTSLTVDLLEKHLLAAETSAVAVGAARGTPRPPFFEGCSPSPLAPSYASAAAAVEVSVAEDVGASSTSVKRRSGKGKGGKGGGGGSGGGGGGSRSSGGGSSGGGGGGGTGGGSGGSGSGGGGSGGSGGSGTGGGGTGARRAGSRGGQRQQQQRRSETQSPQQLREWFLRGASGGSCLTTLTPLSTPVPVRVADPSGGPVVARSSTVLPCPAVLFGSQSSLHLPSFSAKLVSMSGQVAASCSCRLLSHQTLLWHHRLGHPSLPRLRGMHSRLLASGLPRSLPPLPPSPAPPCLPCVEGRQRASPHSSSFPPTTAPLQTLHMDSVPFYRLFPYPSAPPPPPPLFLAPGSPPVDPLPPQGPAPSGVSQVDPLPGPAPVQVAVGSGAARGAASWGAEPGCAESEGAETGGAEPGGVETGGAEAEGVEPRGAASEGAESGGTEPHGAASSGGSAGASPRLSLQQLREWFVQRARLRSGATRAGGAGAAGAGVTGGTAATGPGGARTRGTGAAGSGGVEGARAGDPTESGATGTGGSGAGGAGVGGAGVGGTGTGGAGVGGPGVGGAGAGGAGAVAPGGAVRPQPYFVPLLLQVLGTPSSPGLTPPLLCPPPDQSQPPLQPASPLPAPSRYTERSSGLTERCEPASRPISPIRTARRVPRSRPPPVPGTHAMTLRPSSFPLRVPLPAPPESSLPEVPAPESDRARAASLTISCLLATAVTNPSFESAAMSALVAELLDFAVACRLDYTTALVAESANASPPSVGGECALEDVLEDRQEDFECLAASVPRFASMLLAPEGDPDAPDIPTSRSYAEAITGPYSSQWQAAMDAEMASWKSTGTYVDEVPPPGANIVDGMWIFRVKRPLSSPPVLKARYVARGFSQRQGRDYELHSLDFSTAFLQGSLHEEIWLRRPPGFTESFPAGTQWSLQRPVSGLCQVPREWHDTLRTTLGALGFALATADLLLFLRTDTSLPLFYVLVYVDDLVFATADTEALTLVKSELQKRHTCTDLGHSALRLPNFLAIAHSSVYQPLALSSTFGRVRRAEWSVPRACGLPHVPDDVHSTLLRVPSQPPGSLRGSRQAPKVVLTGHADASWVDDSATQRSSQGYTFSLGSGSVSWRSTRLSSVLSSSCEAKIYTGVMAAQELRWLTYLLANLGEQPRSPPVLYVDNKAMIALCQEHRLEHRTKHIALRYFLARELQQRGQLCLA